MERLVDLFHLGLHHQLHIKGDFGAGAGDEAEEATDLGDAVAYRVPGDGRLPQPKFPHQGGLDLEPAVAERRQRSGGAAEFADQHARPQFAKALPVPVEGRQVGCDLVPEGDRDCLLEIAAARHRGVAVAFREIRKRVRDRHEVRLDEFERLADLQHRRGVGDVLGGGAPMAPFAETAATQRHQLLHDRQHRIADPLGLSLQLGEVVFSDGTMAQNFIAGVLRNDAEARLRPRQRRFDIEIFLDPVLVREDAPHRLGGKDVAEDAGTHPNGGHALVPFESRGLTAAMVALGTKCAGRGPYGACA